jgi:hypothetical protein
MIDRYDPRHIEKATRHLLSDSPVAGIIEDTLNRAQAVHRGQFLAIPDLSRMSNLSNLSGPSNLSNPSIPPDILREYGADAVRMAYLTCPRGFPDETLLESCFCRLGRIRERFSRPESGRFDERIWLRAAGAMSDHLVRRNRPYPGLAEWCAAWKRSPVALDTVMPGKSLVLSLLDPFAPHLSAWLAEILRVPRKAPAELTEAFPAFCAVRIGLERGGWQWEVFPRAAFGLAPLACLRSLPWIQKGFPGVPLSLREEHEGWKICIPRPVRNSDNSSLS